MTTTISARIVWLRTHSMTQINWRTLYLRHVSGALNCGSRRGLQDKVAADRSSGVLGGFIAFEEMINVDDLENPEHDPVDIDEDGVQSKRSTMAVEDLVASKVAVDGGMVDVVEGGDELQDER
jgi:hypothetical protein